VAYEQDLYPKVLVFPDEYKDVDEWLTTRSITNTDDTTSTDTDATKLDPAEEWKEKLKEMSVDGFGRAVQRYQQKYDMQNPVERKKVIQYIFELLSKIQDYSILQMYFSQVSKTL